MCEVRGKRWPKYITNFILGELSYQGCREVPETYISKSYKIIYEDVMFNKEEHYLLYNI